ncbi:MAG: thioredoxin family protein [candidate division WOR-3 bacterium]|nr:MAG: thioredoxin family protein [candidate division WOR-3 bacterium]
MAIIDEKTKEQVRNMFKDLKNEVTLVVFTQDSLSSMPGLECETCKDNRLLMEEVASLSDKIKVEVFDYVKDKNKVEEYGIDKIPATVIKGDRDRGIRIFGLPAGYEFPTLLSAIKLVSAAESDLSDASRTSMKKITKSVHIQVFVTLTCPYCASAAHLAHRLAHHNEMVKADVINAQEFPQLAQKYNVFAVPKIVINESIQFEGALPEDGFVAKVLDSQNSEN